MYGGREAMRGRWCGGCDRGSCLAASFLLVSSLLPPCIRTASPSHELRQNEAEARGGHLSDP